MVELFQNTCDGRDTHQTSLTKAEITLITKSEPTKNPNNFRPIASLNLTYKIYTRCLNVVLTDHCSQNNIIIPEQAAGKIGV